MRLDGRVTSRDYINLLQDKLLPYLDTLEDKEIFIFQEDNAPIHTAKKVAKWKGENMVISFSWPAQSPDLNSNRAYLGQIRERNS